MPNPSGVVVVPTDAFDALLESVQAAKPDVPAARLRPVLEAAERVQRGSAVAVHVPVADARTARDLMGCFTWLADGATGARATVLRRVRDRFRERADILARRERVVQKFRDWRDFRVNDDPPPPVPTEFLRSMLDAGMNAEEVGQVVGMSRAGVYKRVRGYGKERTG